MAYHAAPKKNPAKPKATPMKGGNMMPAMHSEMHGNGAKKAKSLRKPKKVAY